MSNYKGVEDINQFIDYYHGSETKVVVEDPETEFEKSFMGKKEFTTYCLVTKKLGKDPNFIRHRFSEFEGFRTNMKERYCSLGLIVPPVPPKRVIGKGEWNFVVERMYGLTLFCEAFTENPFLANDQAWLEFSFPSEVEGGIENPGEAYLLAALGHCKSVDNVHDLLGRVREEITVIEYYTKNTMEKYKNYQAAVKTHSKALEELSAELKKWGSEEEYLEPLGGRAWNGMATSVNPVDKPIKSVNGAATYYESVASLSSNGVAHVGIFEISILEHLVGLIDSMKELIKMHQTLVSEVETQKAKLSTLRAKKPDPKLEGQIMEVESRIKHGNFKLDSFCKSFFYFSLPLFVRRRTALLKRISVHLGSYALVNSVGLQTASRMLFKAIDQSSDSAINSASAKLAELSKDALLPLPDGFVHESGSSTTPLHPFTSLFSRAADPANANSIDNAYLDSSGSTNNDTMNMSKLAAEVPPPIPPAEENGEFM